MTSEYLNNRVFEGIIERFQKSKRNKVKIEFILADLTDTVKRKADRKANHTSDLKILSEQKLIADKIIYEHNEAKKELATAFYTLSENIVRYAKFQLIDEDDAIQEGVMICFEKIDRFDPRKGKAFNYMTTCILNHFRQLYRTARNYNELKKKYLRHLQFSLDNGTFLRNGREVSAQRNGVDF
jgi:hypothetical protein